MRVWAADIGATFPGAQARARLRRRTATTDPVVCSLETAQAAAGYEAPAARNASARPLRLLPEPKVLRSRGAAQPSGTLPRGVADRGPARRGTTSQSGNRPQFRKNL